MKTLLLCLLTATATTSPVNSRSGVDGFSWPKALAALENLLGPKTVSALENILTEGSSLSTSGPFAPLTGQILESYLEPVNVGVTSTTRTYSSS